MVEQTNDKEQDKTIDEDVMSVISRQSNASETYHEVKDLLKGIFKVPEN